MPGLQALEHGPRGQHDARGREPHGRLRHHRGLPGLPRPQVDGRPTGGDLRGTGSGAAPAVERHHDQRAVPGAVPPLDRRDARDRLPAARHRRLHAGDGHAHVAVDPESSPEGHRPRRRQALSQLPAGGDLPAGGRAAAGCWQRDLVLDLLELEEKAAANPVLAEGFGGPR